MRLRCRRQNLLAAVVWAGALLSVACGGGPESPPPATTTTTGGSGSGFILIGDAPPEGSTILKFEITLTSALLCPTVGTNGECEGTTQPELLAAPVEIELNQLQLESAFLALAEVPEGTYNGVKLTFADPELKVLLADGTLQELEEPQLTLDPAMITPTFDEALTVTADTDFGFLVDFNIFDSIQTDAAGNITSISPMVTLVKLPDVGQGGDLEQLEDVLGTISNLSATCPTGTFDLTTSGSSVTITGIRFDETTEFEGEEDTTFDCLSLADGLVVEVDLRLRATASLDAAEFFAEEIELVGPPDEDELEGMVFQVNSSSQFVLLVLEEENAPTVEVGSFVTVNLTAGTQFRIDDEDELTLPASLSFASGDDLLAGQFVEVEVANGSLVIPEGSTCAEVTGADGDCTATADEVELDDGSLTAQVASVGTSSFVLDTLPSIFGSDPDNLRAMSADCQSCFVGSISVSTSGETEFRDTLTGVGDLNVGDTVTVRGSLFKNGFGPPEPGAGEPELVATRVRRR